MNSSPLEVAMIELSRFVMSESTLSESLTCVAELATQAVPEAEFIGLSMLDDNGVPSTPIYTDERSPEIDSMQYKTGIGPCLDAWRTRKIVRVDDMVAAETKYEEFARIATSVGIKSTLSVPLVVRDQAVGAMNLYSSDPGGFSEDSEQNAITFGAAGSVLLINSNSYWEARRLSETLSEAMASRAVIEQAKGMLMAQKPGTTADDAFDLLRKASQRENIKLREIAERMVDRVMSSGR